MNLADQLRGEYERELVAAASRSAQDEEARMAEVARVFQARVDQATGTIVGALRKAIEHGAPFAWSRASTPRSMRKCRPGPRPKV